MMKPSEVKEVAFRKSFNGYNYEDVDAYIEEVAESYEKLYTENAQLLAKMDVLVERIEKYRADEDSLHAALLNAQKMGEDIKKKAQKEAEAIVTRAAERTRSNEQNYTVAASAKKYELDEIVKAIEALKEQMSGIFRRQITDIEALAEEAERRAAHINSIWTQDAPAAEAPQEEPEEKPEPEAPAAQEPVVTEPEPAPEATEAAAPEIEVPEMEDATKVFSLNIPEDAVAAPAEEP